MASLVKTRVSRYRAPMLLTLTLLLGACATPPGGGVPDSLMAEGLEPVNARRFDSVQVRPDTDFSRFSAVMLAAPVLEYREPDRSRQEVPLDQTRKQEFVDYLAELFGSELESMGSPELVTEGGPGVIELAVSLIDITATVPPRSAGPAGRVSIALSAGGDVTLVMDFTDTDSGELLSRVVDRKAVDGVAIAKGGELVTRWEDVEAITARWARLTRQGLEAALSSR